MQKKSHPDPFFNFLEGGRDSIAPLIYKQSTTRKEYFRFPQIILPTPLSINTSLTQALTARRSTRKFGEGSSVTLEELSTLLYYSVATHTRYPIDTVHRTYPSGGGRYPVDIYVLSHAVTNIASGAYHYRPDTHVLETLIPVDVTKLATAIFDGREEVIENYSGVVLFSFTKQRSMAKYANHAYKLGLLEAGHICQNIYLLMGSLGLAGTAIGMNQRMDAVSTSLRLDGVNEIVCYGFVFGRPVV